MVCCITAAELHGLWVPAASECLHVGVPANSARLRRPDDPRVRLEAEDAAVIVHWIASRARGIQPLPDAIALVIGCCGPEVGFVLLESALFLGRMTPGERARLSSLAPRSFRRLSRVATKDSGSGTESLMKLLLISLGLSFVQQVKFPGIGWVDFLVGDSLVIEVDSKTHHADPYADRKRDAALSALGKRTLRFMYSQLVYERDAVEAAIVGAIIRGDANR
jgi:very-short-patch-repair endonuclease